jgi:membrane protein YqaA with SNARE-associated domain
MSEIVRPEPVKLRGLRAVYAWMLRNASGRHAWAALALFAFAEASFFPIPPDVMLVPMMLADRRRAFLLAAWCAFWSVMGGMLGYVIGAVFWQTLGVGLIHLLHIPLAEIEALRLRYSAHAYLIVAQGMTPIPYKLVTISSGLAGVPFALFMLYSAVTRTVRFVVFEGLLVHFFGVQAKVILEKYLEWIMVGFLALVVLGFFALRYI